MTTNMKKKKHNIPHKKKANLSPWWEVENFVLIVSLVSFVTNSEYASQS